jgi:hypothetical protein
LAANAVCCAANFEEGLAALLGEASSLHGAFHVFEQKFADTLPFDICRTAVSLHRPRAALSNGGGFLFAQGKNGIL